MEERAALFVYLNRFGFNGLCRYNRSGYFNVPWGKPAQVPYFPEAEVRAFAHKAQRATFCVGRFESTMLQAKAGDVVYCDPPYADARDTKTFTHYAGNTFSWKDQERLADVASELALVGVTVVVSNHDTPATRKLYKNASIYPTSVSRSIAGCASARGVASELITVHKAC